MTPKDIAAARVVPMNAQIPVHCRPRIEARVPPGPEVTLVLHVTVIANITDTDATVLIRGESGVGKDSCVLLSTRR